MTRPGWTYDAESECYSARASASKDCTYALSISVFRWNSGEWVANYGWSGVSFSAYNKHPTPEAAADEAEAWLRGMLAQFDFPWLEVK